MESRHAGSGISVNTCFKRAPQVLRIICMYWFAASICTNLVTRRASASYTSRSSGNPHEMLERSVESIDTSAHLAASSSGVPGCSTRSMIGLPYLASPIWKYGFSCVASMKLPAE